MTFEAKHSFMIDLKFLHWKMTREYKNPFKTYIIFPLLLLTRELRDLTHEHSLT